MTKTVMNKSEERLLLLMQLLSDETRYRMFKLMLHQPGMCVGDIAAALGVSASAVSQHYRQFELLGLVVKVRTGQRICYQLKANDQIVTEFSKLINQRIKEK